MSINAFVRHALAPAVLLAIIAMFMPAWVDVSVPDAGLTVVNQTSQPMRVSFRADRSRCSRSAAAATNVVPGQTAVLQVEIDPGLVCRLLPATALFEVLYCPQGADGAEQRCEYAELQHMPTAPAARVAVFGSTRYPSLATTEGVATVVFHNAAAPEVVKRSEPSDVLPASARQAME